MRLVTIIQRHRKVLAPCSCRLHSTFRADDLRIQLTDKPKIKPDPSKLTFGAEFSDHMLEVNWTAGQGWESPVIKPLEPFIMHPASKVLHYAQEIFDGLKAYRCVDGTIRLFRPNENMRRVLRGAKRAAFPTFEPAEMLKCIKKLIHLDSEWVPYSDSQCSLYVRPSMIGVEPTLGLASSAKVKFFVITCPVGAYYPTGLKPVQLLADPQFVRACPKGSGSYKLGSNYAPTLAIQEYALKEHNCQQVLWLYGEDHQMTEVGSMNLFVYWINEKGEEELVTPPLESGLILPGITRKSLLELTREWNEFKVTERDMPMGTLVKAVKEGRLKEVFGAGTACVVSPVDKIVYQGDALHINTGKDTLTQRLYDALLDIQYYRTPHKWMETLDV